MKKAIKKIFRRGKNRSERKGTQPYDIALKAKIIREYLKGEKSFAMLGVQYSIHPGVISRWVRVVRYGTCEKAGPQKITKFTGMAKKVKASSDQLLKENQVLKKQLEEEQLKTMVYEKMIEVMKRDYNVDILKKYGAKRSLK